MFEKIRDFWGGGCLVAYLVCMFGQWGNGFGSLV